MNGSCMAVYHPNRETLALHALVSRSALIGRWWFLAIGVALFGAGIFYPYPTPNIASYIHGICGVIVIVTSPIAATLYSSGLAHSQDWTASRGRLPWAVLL